MIKKLKSIIILSLIPFSLFASELQFVGKVLLEYSVFKIDIYEISYYRGKNREELRLDYKRDLERKYSIKGWEKGLEGILKEKPSYLPKAKWLYDNTIELKEGDLLTIRKDKDKNQITFLKNNKKLSTIIDPIVTLLAFEPWLGKYPVSLDMKKKLFGNSF
jgi:hypothetical protein